MRMPAAQRQWPSAAHRGTSKGRLLFGILNLLVYLAATLPVRAASSCNLNAIAGFEDVVCPPNAGSGALVPSGVNCTARCGAPFPNEEAYRGTAACVNGTWERDWSCDPCTLCAKLCATYGTNRWYNHEVDRYAECTPPLSVPPALPYGLPDTINSISIYTSGPFTIDPFVIRNATNIREIRIKGLSDEPSSSRIQLTINSAALPRLLESFRMERVDLKSPVYFDAPSLLSLKLDSCTVPTVLNLTHIMHLYPNLMTFLHAEITNPLTKLITDAENMGNPHLVALGLAVHDVASLYNLPWSSWPNLVELEYRLQTGPPLLSRRLLPNNNALVDFRLTDLDRAFSYIALDTLIDNVDFDNIEPTVENTESPKNTLVVFQSQHDANAGYGSAIACYLVEVNLDSILYSSTKRIVCLCEPPANGVDGYYGTPHCPYQAPIACKEHKNVSFFPSQLCNGVPDCPSGSDEAYCAGILVTRNFTNFECYGRMNVTITAGLAQLVPLPPCNTVFAAMRDYDALDGLVGPNFWWFVLPGSPTQMQDLEGSLYAALHFSYAGLENTEVVLPLAVREGAIFGREGSVDTRLPSIVDLGNQSFTRRFNARYPAGPPETGAATVHTTLSSSTVPSSSAPRPSASGASSTTVLAASIGAALALSLLAALLVTRHRRRRQHDPQIDLVLGRLIEDARVDFETTYPRLKSEPLQLIDARQLTVRRILGSGHFSVVSEGEQAWRIGVGSRSRVRSVWEPAGLCAEPSTG
ncbi:uncharacterized protein MONBRDRAFT_36767 [Monosiga brevicollis MX1]|uniref:TNFR-Cys domain-containing protein n=1 Tax=Monosiga brevicollis TaxID=81824 RepID=A9UXE2_MONBE|nr:uncharacterized protein MONBRDRAFT_36767 [Monosiga brevicollis MX1]EDQ90376.1 predicted protein [Monosiga brevicollis MX1]|eukprot:XP_001745143.1 hypothetical protein [Monosiga brevicollis MX1]